MGDSPINSSTNPTSLQGCQPHTSSNMENISSPASNNKASNRGVESRPNSRVQWGGGGGGTINSTRNNNATHFRFSCQKFESSTNRKIQLSRRLQTQIWRSTAQNLEITVINLDTGRYGSKSGDCRHKSGDREIQFKIWRLPDYPGELTALSLSPHTMQENPVLSCPAIFFLLVIKYGNILKLSQNRIHRIGLF